MDRRQQTARPFVKHFEFACTQFVKLRIALHVGRPVVSVEFAHPLCIFLGPHEVGLIAPVHISALLLLCLTDDVPLNLLNKRVVQIAVADDVSHLGQLGVVIRARTVGSTLLKDLLRHRVTNLSLPDSTLNTTDVGPTFELFS